MFKRLTMLICGLVLTLSLAGCGSTANPTTSNQSSSMKGMKMNPSSSLSQAFEEELNGFTTIENDMKKGDYQSAKTLADKLHNVFHAEILQPLKDKKGETYAENIHSKYDELQDAVSSKDNAKINQMIKVNRDNLKTVAKILNVSLTN